MISTLTQEDSLNAVKSPSANADARTGSEERMWQARNILANRFPETLDLFARNRGSLSFTPHEPKYTWRPQYLQAFLDVLNYADERITAK